MEKLTTHEGQENNPEDKKDFSQTFTSYQSIKYTLNGIPANDPSYGFVNYQKNNATVEVFKASGILNTLPHVRGDVRKLTEGKTPQQIVNDPAIVELVAVDTKLQKSVLGDENETEGYIDMSYIEMAEGVPYGTYSKKKDIISQQDISVKSNEKKAPFLRDAIDLIRERDERIKRENGEGQAAKKLEEFKKTAEEYTANDDIIRPINGDVQPVKEIVGYLQESVPVEGEVDRIKKEQAYELKIKTWKEQQNKIQESLKIEEQEALRTPEERDAFLKKYIQECKEGTKKTEQVLEVNKKKQEQAVKNLEAMGLTKVGKGLEAFKNMSGKKRLLLGIALAGLSVATGGATSFISKGLSALTFGLRDFDKEKQKALERGETVNVGTMIKSGLTGVVLALGTSALFEGVTHVVAQHASPMFDSIKHFFSPEVAAVAHTPDAAAVTVPHSTPVEVLPVTPEVPLDPSASVVTSLPTEYEIKPGDNLTKIISSEVIDKMPGGSELTSAQRENVVQNILAHLQAQPDDLRLTTLLQFNDPNLIQPGQHIDPQAIAHFIQNESLLNHAAALDSASIVANHAAAQVLDTGITETITPNTVSLEGTETAIPFVETPTEVVTEQITVIHEPVPVVPDVVIDMSPITNLSDTYIMKSGDTMDSILNRVLLSVPEAKDLSTPEKAELIKKFTSEWSTWFSGFSTPNHAIKEMLAGMKSGTPGMQVHHLDHVKDAFVTLLTRGKN